MDSITEALYSEIQNIYLPRDKQETGFWKRKVKDQGLEEIARSELFRKSLSDTLKHTMHSGIVVRPHRKSIVMIIGNHSAGKSSFINWYIQQELQSTGIALETSHFTMITSGENEAAFQGPAAVALYPFLRELMNVETELKASFFDNLTTKVSTSRSRLFSHVDFIDTPGVIDGKMRNHCDVPTVVKWLAHFVDLIVVFLDPIGQALRQSMTDLITELNKYHQSKLKIYLSKADMVTKAEEMNKIYTQLSMHLDQSILSQEGYNILPICIPTDQPLVFTNRIDSLLKEIEKSVNMKLVHNLSVLRNDSRFIYTHIQRLIRTDILNRSKMNTVNTIRFFCSFLAMFFLGSYLNYVTFPATKEFDAIGILISISSILLSLLYSVETLTSSNRRLLIKWSNYCENAITKCEGKIYTEMHNSFLSKFVLKA
jgi:GTPase Era involved in 16S rRNA processing